MTVAQVIALVSGLTALVIAAGHLVADVNGTMDKIRKNPVKQPAAPQLPPTPPAGS